MDYFNLNDVLGDIAVGRYDVRLAAIEGTNGFMGRYLVARRVDQQSQPEAGWSYYDYGDIIFLRDEVPGDLLASWLQQEHGQLNNIAFDLPTSGQVSVNHVPSGIPYGCITLAVPSLRYSLNLNVKDSVQRGHPLLADGSPYFPDFHAAVLDLIYEFTDNDTASPAPLVIVWPHSDAYLSNISFQPLTLKIQIDGKLSAPVSLNVYARQPSLHHMSQIHRPEEHIVPLLKDVPGEIHVVLSRGSSLLDRKIIRTSLDVRPDLTDPSTLQALIAQGESVRLEFKREFPRHPDQWLKTVVAFANRDGGVLIFGVDPETGFPAGVQEDINEFEVNISNQISTRVDPGIAPDVHTVIVQGNPLVAVNVPPGVHKPYSLVIKNGEKGVSRKYFFRIGSSSFEANPEHIRSAILAASGNGGR